MGNNVTVNIAGEQPLLQLVSISKKKTINAPNAANILMINTPLYKRNDHTDCGFKVIQGFSIKAISSTYYQFYLFKHL